VAALCPITGQAYPSDVVFMDNGSAINASRFRFFHTVLTTQQQFINALKTVYAVADNLAEQGIQVYVYSIWYVFFEQYLYIDITASVTIGLALGKLTPSLYLMRHYF
jgi:Niemann-Pick C1 protein